MSVYFPPDVRVRMDGEPGDVRPYLGRARDVLFKALNMQAAGQALPIKLTQRLDDNAYAQVLLTGNQKIVFISAGAVNPEVRSVPPEEIRTENIPPPFFDMLSGWVAPGNITTGTNTATGLTFKQLELYKPTHDTAIEQKFKEVYGKIKRLAVPGLSPVVLNPSPALFQGSELKSSMYSGSMKEIIQALMGLGIITDNSKTYITGELPVPMKRPIQVKYDYKWARTHGVLPSVDGAGNIIPKNWWLIEISVTNGVLAMPLPLLKSTTRKGYHAKLKARKAVESLAVVDKYGGLPSGEPFPSGTELADAITAGKILQLLLPADLDDFYTRLNYATQLGWAFAETAQKADNTCWDFDDVLGIKVGYHYGIDFTLGPWDLHNLDLDFPIGTGSAVLKRRNHGYLGGPSDNIFQPVMPPIRIWDEALQSLDLFDFTVDGDVTALDDFGRQNTQITSDTPMLVYYRGNELEQLYYYDPKSTTNQTVADHLGTITRHVNAQFYGTSIDKRAWSWVSTGGPVYWRNNSATNPEFSIVAEHIVHTYGEPGHVLLSTTTYRLSILRTDYDRIQRLPVTQFGGAVIPRYLREGYVVSCYTVDNGFQRNFGFAMESRALVDELVGVNHVGSVDLGVPGLFGTISDIDGAVVSTQSMNDAAPFWQNNVDSQTHYDSYESLDYFYVVGNYGVLLTNSLREDDSFGRQTGDITTAFGPVDAGGEFGPFTLPQIVTTFTQIPAPVGGYPPTAAWNKFIDPLVLFDMQADFNAGPNKGFILEGRAVRTSGFPADVPDIVADYVRRGPNLDGLTPQDISWIGRV